MLDKKVYHAREELEKGFCFAQAVQAGTMLYISGCLSWDENGDVLAPGDLQTQARNVYEDIRKCLAAHGATFANIVKETLFTLDMDAMVVAAPIRAEFYDAGAPAAATWVQVERLVKPGFMLEVEVIATLA